MKRRLQQIDESIERYLGQIASADRQEAAIAEPKAKRLERQPGAELFQISSFHTLWTRFGHSENAKEALIYSLIRS